MIAVRKIIVPERAVVKKGRAENFMKMMIAMLKLAMPKIAVLIKAVL
jgi:hypothetical protein